MNIALLALTLAAYALFSAGAIWHFRRVQGTPPLLLLLSLAWIATVGSHVAALWPGRALAPTAWLALPMLAGGAALWLWAAAASRRARLSLAFSADLPERLIAVGPYRLVRHPFYSAYMLTWLAGWVATWRWWTLAPALAACALVTLAARAEEGKFARSRLAGDYAAYRARAGMFLPRWRGGAR